MAEVADLLVGLVQCAHEISCDLIEAITEPVIGPRYARIPGLSLQDEAELPALPMNSAAKYSTLILGPAEGGRLERLRARAFPATF